MRLTLRTLLAYMDEILEPADREELAKKVESSDFANDLILRTKDTMRRLRLSAPQVVGTGIGLDPNTVAEYLDNVLPPDSVADFERICLESDVHLAEVASAHHVLTMVLGEPAEVDPAARQRMYAIPTELEDRKHHRIEAAHIPQAVIPEQAAVAGPPAYVPPVAASISPASRARAADEVPDYLRASSWTTHGGLLAMCAAVLLVAVGVLLFTGYSSWFGGPQQVAGGPGGGLSNSLQAKDAAAEDEESVIETDEEVVADEEAVESVGEGTAEGASEEVVASSGATATLPATPPRLMMPSLGNTTPPAETAAVPAATAPPVTVGVDESAYGFGEGAATESSTVAEDRYAVEPAEPAPPVVEPVAATPDPSAIANVTPTPPANQVDPPQTVDAGTPAMSAPEPMANDLAASTTQPPAAESVSQPVAEDTQAVESADAGPIASNEPVELGTYLDGKNVLVRFDPQSGAWFRMPPRATLHAGDKLLALPGFYPKLSLASGLHLKLAGGSLITFGQAAVGSNVPAIDVAYGKVVIVNTANNASGLKLTIGSETADVRLGRNATLAMEVTRKYVPGLDPRKSPSPILATLYAREGDVEWTDALGNRTIPAPGQWTIDNGVVSSVSADATFPDWIDSEPVDSVLEQRWGVPAVEKALTSAQPVEGQLLTLYESSRRREEKSLVARSSVYAGLFVPFVESLRDSDQKGAWKQHIDTLRMAMALGPESADKVYQTLVDQRGEAAAADLYEMLCGYGPEQIGTPEEFAGGLATQLVDWMEDDNLDYRVLAVQDMSEITGKRIMGDPAGRPSDRAVEVRRWRQRIKDGEVTPKTP